MIFIKLDVEDAGPAPESKLVGLKSVLDNAGFSDALKFVKRKHYEIKCDWKVYVDNYLDGGYHVEYAHRDLGDLLSLGTYQTEIRDGYSIQKSTGKDQDSRVGTDIIYAHIFPNVMINRYGPWMDVNYVIPKSHDSCVVTFDWFLEKDLIKSSDDAKLSELINEGFKDSERVQIEDIEICNRVQKGLKSISYHFGRYAPNVEEADHDFHKRIAGHLKDHLSK